jgi:Tetratricopeptide repeat
MAELAEALGLADPTAAASEATARLLDELCRRDRWLLLFDDAASPRELARFLPGGPGHVLVCSTDPGWREHGTSLPVQPFSRPESVGLLRSRRPGLTAAEADRVAAALEDRPLAVDPAGATLADTGMSVSTYLGLLSEQRRGARAAAGAEAASSAAWAVAFERLATDDPPALALLTLVAWLAPQPLPLSVLIRHPNLLPAPLARTEQTPTWIAERAATLRRRGLARVGPDTVQLHRAPAAQLVARTADDRPGHRGWPVWAVRLLHAAVPADPDNPAGWPMWRQLLPHVLTATDPARGLDEVDVGWLLNHAAGYLQARGEPRGARALFEDAFELYRRQLGLDDPDTLASARSLATNLRALGQHEQARRILQDIDIDAATERSGPAAGPAGRSAVKSPGRGVEQQAQAVGDRGGAGADGELAQGAP